MLYFNQHENGKHLQNYYLAKVINVGKNDYKTCFLAK